MLGIKELTYTEMIGLLIVVILQNTMCIFKNYNFFNFNKSFSFTKSLFISFK